MQKKLTIAFLAFLGLAFVACNDTTCHISGTIPENFNGKKIFLVPTTNDSRFNVDSMVVENGKFHFDSDTTMLAEIRVDYHYRMGIQPLLVVVEPGNVKVVIDSISSAVGTPSNDSLNAWKTKKQVHDLEYRQMTKMIQKWREEGDTVQANRLKGDAHEYHLKFKQMTRQMANNQPEGILRDFLGSLYPLTYKRMMPDSTIVEYDADTNEPISK